jgi:two-component system sensor histidine kinase/response regulator
VLSTSTDDVTESPSEQARQGHALVTRHTLIEARGRARARVLLAEDNLVNQRVAAKMLEKVGCTVDIAGNGVLAMEALANAHYDLVLMDCQMPEMDGFEATAAIREREGDGPRVPIIAMTANAMAGDRERCLAAGMDGYLSKPVRADDLTAVISEWLPAAGSAEADGVATADVPELTPAEEDDQTLIDRDQLRTLRELDGGGSSSFVLELVDAFIDEGGEEIAQVRAAVLAGDANALVRSAHRLKGSALNMGCGALAQTAESLESMGRRGSLVDAEHTVVRLMAEFDSTAAALRIEADAA